MKRQIEVFTAGCPVCEPTVKTVKEMACDSCEVTVYDLVKQCDDKVCIEKMKEYNITSLPAIAVNGKLLACCQSRGVSKEELAAAGIGKAI
ncbi:thioredoxin family protein [Algoriphagus sp. AGSA1]|jgi:hypothetical protein|uniref:thioredoxin family protein n=1 Tax=unclassified Algoriphagus TaxID=2641541 RepID=UPI001F2CE5BA|nr:thioredoxin family protein [Algoriphagus sp. AGSA1]MCE7053942.1 thioredoxin family protein [Algoriphagus sp. AGSA1]|tara:strand:+ start:593 stop:865 length:273 start_codon:yes stop_codon:yes gene_type:complete